MANIVGASNNAGSVKRNTYGSVLMGKMLLYQKLSVECVNTYGGLGKWAVYAQQTFACFTGLAIADMEHLQYGHIQTAAGGQKYIRKERQKTKVEFVVPLHPIAEVIIEHCKAEQERNGGMQSVKEKGETETRTDSLVFPRDCSRSVIAAKLSIVGRACGIRERLSYHMARHTFGTMSLSAGIPIESIAKMMGHASIASTQIYAQVTDNKISEDMDRLIRKYQKEKVKEEAI